MPPRWEGKLWRQIKSAVYNRDLEALKEILSSNNHHETGNSEEEPPLCESLLYLAITRGYLDVVKFLVLEQKVNLNKISQNYAATDGYWDEGDVEEFADRTPLTLAIEDENAEMVQFLLEHGANPNISGNYLLEPMCIAVNQGLEDIVKLLLNHGANIDGIHIPGCSTLIDAVRCGNEGIATLLLDAGATISAAALLKAIQGRSTKFVSLFLARGADLNSVSEPHSALQCAVMYESIEIVQLLLDHGADIHALNDQGRVLCILLLRKTLLQSSNSFLNVELILK